MLADLDETARFLTKRNAKLLKTSRRRTFRPERTETYQRMFDLSARKRKILAGQRERLGQLDRALRERLGQQTSPRATRYLAGCLKKEKDPVLRETVLALLVDAKAVHTLPALILATTVGGRKRNLAVYEAMRQITGTDLPSRRKAWRRWWREREKEERA